MKIKHCEIIKLREEQSHKKNHNFMQNLLIAAFVQILIEDKISLRNMKRMERL